MDPSWLASSAIPEPGEVSGGKNTAFAVYVGRMTKKTMPTVSKAAATEHVRIFLQRPKRSIATTIKSISAPSGECRKMGGACGLAESEAGSDGFMYTSSDIKVLFWMTGSRKCYSQNYTIRDRPDRSGQNPPHFPIQKLENIRFSISSAVVSPVRPSNWRKAA
jgi:hypothetical protein